MKTGKKIQELRLSKGVTVLELSRELRIDHFLLEQWESGYILPHKHHIKRLSEYFEVSEDEIADVNLLYKLWVFAQVIRDNWIKIFFTSFVGVLVIGYLLQLLIGISIFMFNSGTVKTDKASQAISVYETDEFYSFRIRLITDMHTHNSLDTDLVLNKVYSIDEYEALPDYNVWTIDDFEVINRGNAEIISIIVTFEPGVKEDIIKLEATIGNELDERYRVSYTSIVTHHEEKEDTTSPMIKRYGNIAIVGLKEGDNDE